MIEEYFGDGSVSIKAYVCILESMTTSSSKSKMPLSLITTDKDKALRLKREYLYDVYSIKLLSEVME